jgi:hypothetical protein
MLVERWLRRRTTDGSLDAEPLLGSFMLPVFVLARVAVTLTIEFSNSLAEHSRRGRVPAHHQLGSGGTLQEIVDADQTALRSNGIPVVARSAARATEACA